MEHNPLDLDRLAANLASFTITPTNPIQISQMKHRLAVLAAWFGSVQQAFEQLRRRCIIELGCGQGDMTVALAHAVSEQESSSEGQIGQVLAIDPASLDYGSPYTLGQSQAHLANSSVGHAILWIQKDPIDYLLTNPIQADYIVLAHSLFYLPSETYFESLLQTLHRNSLKHQDGGVKQPLVERSSKLSTAKLLLAEWGMRASTDAAEAHILAVQAQMKCPIAEANVRTVLDPARMIAIAEKAGWVLESEQWIEKPQLDDGKWEVSAASDLRNNTDNDAELSKTLADMEDVIKKHDGAIASMDVWTAVFAVS